jgi:hypothetical protein
MGGFSVIFQGSRYENVGVYTATDADGRAVVALALRVVPDTPAGYYHTVVDGQRLDNLAYTFYRNPERFWLIADANADTAMDPDDLTATGRTILIPPDRTT